MAWNDGLENGTPTFNLASTDSQTIRAVAGPGSGKSFAIKRRVARLLENNVPPEQILAITFTRTAAQDLKREIYSLGIPGADEVHSRTLHSHALKILIQAEVLARTGRKPRMVIEHEIAPTLRDLEKDIYQGLKEKKILLDSYLAAWACLQSDTPGFVKEKVQEAFEKDLIQWLTEHNGLLVGEVIPVAIEYLRNNPASSEIGKYADILVDEYQDLNKSEQEFIRLIRGNSNIVIVGDDDQSIYGFKFAHPEGIQEIDKLHGKFEDIQFSECRRCPKQVTVMASELILKNPNRTLGKLVPHEKNQDGLVQIVQWKTYEEEIAALTKIITTELAKGEISPQDVLVLAPRRRIGYLLRDNLLAAGLPVKSYFRESAIAKDQVRRAYSLLNLLSNPSDTISLRYLIGFGSADFRKAQYQKLKEIANEKHLSQLATLNEILKGKIEDKGLKTIVEEFRKVQAEITNIRKEILNNPADAFQTLFIKTDEDEIEFYELNQIYKKSVEEVGIEILADQNEFDNWFNEVFKNLQETIALPDSPDNIDHIRIMSLHSSKGLSGKLVILCSMIDHLMPFIPDGLTPEQIEHNVQEQRRLFYVAITRCKASDNYPGRLIISSFLSIFGLNAVRMGIPASPKSYLKVASTRFLKDFGKTAPLSILGDTLL
jgi:DNA helicase II / ATP-dependent DNA helicase PcrA